MASDDHHEVSVLYVRGYVVFLFAIYFCGFVNFNLFYVIEFKLNLLSMGE